VGRRPATFQQAVTAFDADGSPVDFISGSIVVERDIAWGGRSLPGSAAAGRINPMNLKYGAKGIGGDDSGPFNQAIADLSAAGGGTLEISPPPIGFWGLASPLVPKSNVLLQGFPGCTFKWIAGDPGVGTYMCDTGDPGAGRNVQRANLYSLIFDSQSVNRVHGIRAVSLQYAVWLDVGVKNMTWVGGEGYRFDALSGTTFVNNNFGNRFIALRGDSVDKLMTLSGLSNGVATTDNDFYNVFAGDIRNNGVRFVQWCDSNRFYGIRIGASGVAGTLICLVMNDSVTPAVDVGVYNERFFTLFADMAGGFGGAAQRVIRLNWTYGNRAEVWTSVGPGGSPGQFIEDNNSQSHLIELDSGNPISGNAGAIQTYSKNWFAGGPGTDAGGGNFLKHEGAAPGGITKLTALGTDAAIGVSINPKGTGEVVLGQQQPNFFKQGGGADGVASSPYITAAGGATDVDLRILNQGAGRVVLKGALMPCDEAGGTQTSGGVRHSTGIPANGNGVNNDWAISDNGHFYFKTAGAWVQKI